MKKLNIYLDTSVINFLYADDSPEKKQITEDFFNEYVGEGRFNAYVSDVVIEEIEKTKDGKKKKQLLNVIAKYGLSVFQLTDEAIELSQKYLNDGVIPERKVDDARHLAIATVNEIDVLVSWNFKHLANVNKERGVIAVNIKAGYNYPLRLTTLLEVMDE